MMTLFGLAAVALIVLILVDSFETTVLPRRVTHRFRFARLYYLTIWRVWRAVAVRISRGNWREAFLSLCGEARTLAKISATLRK